MMLSIIFAHLCFSNGTLLNLDSEDNSWCLIDYDEVFSSSNDYDYKQYCQTVEAHEKLRIEEIHDLRLNKFEARLLIILSNACFYFFEQFLKMFYVIF